MARHLRVVDYFRGLVTRMFTHPSGVACERGSELLVDGGTEWCWFATVKVIERVKSENFSTICNFSSLLGIS